MEIGPDGEVPTGKLGLQRVQQLNLLVDPTVNQNANAFFDPAFERNWQHISEPYWTRVKVGGIEKDVLVQAFERRILTYTPSNDPAFQVEMGNVGRAYYNWRYTS